MAVPKKSIQIVKALPPFKSHGSFSTLLVVEEMIDNTSELGQDTKLSSMDFIDGEIDTDFKKRVFHNALKFLNEFCDNISNLEAADVLFEYHMRLLPLVHIENYPETIKKQYESSTKSLKKCQEQMKVYMQLEKSRPKALRLYEPNIEKVYINSVHIIYYYYILSAMVFILIDNILFSSKN